MPKQGESDSESVQERERERKVTPSLALSHTNSLFLCLLAGDRVIRPDGKQRAVCRSVQQIEHAPKSNKTQKMREGRERRGEQESNITYLLKYWLQYSFDVLLPHLGISISC